MTTPLTTLLTEHSGEFWWAIRITDPDLCLTKTYDLFNKYDKFIVSEEGDGDNTRIHHHVILITPENSDQIKAYIRTVYPNAKGNKCIYVKPCKDKRQLAKYTLKEGKYKYKGYSKTYIDDMFKTSAPKTDLNREITQNEEAYILDRITTEQFVERYIDIKVRHNQNLYTNHIVAYVRRMMVRSGNFTSADYARSVIFAINPT